MRVERGYTLYELLFTIIIIGVIVSIALPRYTASIEKMRSAEGVQTLTAILNAEKMFYIDNNHTYTTDINQLDVEIPNSSIFSTPELQDDPTALATVRRNDPNNAYYLTIDENGIITCTGDSCPQLGY